MNTLHLFAGAGGGIIADMLLGHRPVGAVEIDNYCRRVLYQRQQDGWLPKFPIFKDVKHFYGNEIRKRVDMVCGGFPCQDISVAGCGEGITGSRSGLFFELARICYTIRPRFIFLENSPAIVSRGLDTVLGTLTEMGYDAEWCCLSAGETGAWHKRERWWCLCADSDCTRELQQKRTVKDKRGRTGNLCQEFPDAKCAGLERQRNDAGKPTFSEPGDGGETNEFRWWKTEPGVGRVAHGVANRVDRLKAIGNGQVPVCAAIAFKILLERMAVRNMDFGRLHKRH